jgi:(4S)-4-hydroxy-5-phosphonooxypentane-2,3-dione isomerase
MFAVVVTLRARPGAAEALLAALRRNAAASLAREPGCLRFDVLRRHDDPDQFLLYEVYVTRHAFRVGHLGSAHFAQWQATAPALVVDGSKVDAYYTLDAR